MKNINEKFRINGKIINKNRGKFSVEIQTEDGPVVIKNVYASGRMRINNICFVVGDSVLLELDCNDFKGRIIKRL